MVMKDIKQIYESDDVIIDIIGKDLRISYFEDNHWKSESRLLNFENQEKCNFEKDSW
jgi:hypothetical protein